MKRLFILAMMAMTVLAASAIKPKRVKWSCDVTKVNAQMKDTGRKWTLNNKYCGWCYVRPTDSLHLGHNGLLIYKTPYTHEYKVYDLKCPVCDKKGRNASVKMDETVTATCPKCNTSFNITTTGYPVDNMMTDAWLESYECTLEDNILYIDNSPGFGQRLKMWEMDNINY